MGSVFGVGIILLGCVGEVMNQAQTLALERDWVVVIAEQSGNPLKTLNMLMRRIDLSCKLLAPAAVSCHASSCNCICL